MQMIDLLNRSMTAEALRFRVISDNIANVDTPHFKRSAVVFESALKRVMTKDKNKSANTSIVKMQITHPTHITNDLAHLNNSVSQIQPRVQLEYNSSYRNDKNNVNIHTEMTEAAKSVLRYNSYANFVNRYFKKINFLLR